MISSSPVPEILKEWAAKPSTITPIQQTNAYAQTAGKLIDATYSNANNHFIILIKSVNNTVQSYVH